MKRAIAIAKNQTERQYIKNKILGNNHILYSNFSSDFNLRKTNRWEPENLDDLINTFNAINQPQSSSSFSSSSSKYSKYSRRSTTTTTTTTNNNNTTNKKKNTIHNVIMEWNKVLFFISTQKRPLYRGTTYLHAISLDTILFNMSYHHENQSSNHHQYQHYQFAILDKTIFTPYCKNTQFSVNQSQRVKIISSNINQISELSCSPCTSMNV